METENGEKITLDEIKTMTLEDFKNLLNSALSVPTNPTSQCSDSPRSQESSDSFRNQTKTFVRHAKDSEKGPSWRSVREKARNVCDSASTRNYQRNMNNNNSHNKDNSRPKTPTSNYRPKTPTSGIKSAYSRPITPTSRPKTPSSSARSSEEDLTYRGYIRPRAPSKASSFSSLDDEDAAEVADINGCGLSRSSKESSPAESVDRNPPMRSRTPGISGIPRPSTPSGIPRSITPASSSKPSTPSMARKHSLPDGTQRRVSLTRPTTPSEKPDKTYTGMYQARRSKTPGPNQERSYIPGGNRSITPGPRESWSKPPVSGSNQADGERRNRTVSRSLDFNRQRSKSVVDVRLDEESPLTVKSDQIKDAAAAASEDSRSRMKSKILALAEKRQRSISTGPKKSQDSADKKTVLMITRGKGGGHSITVEDNGETTYKSGCPGTPKANRASLVNGNAERYRQRSKTPDPRLTNARTRSVEPRSIMARRNSDEPSAQSVSKRLEAWVDSTVNENKRKIPPRPKRSMTPNSLEFTEKDLEPRPFEEIKAALEKPVNGVVEDQTVLAPPPEDPEMFMKMEKLFAKYREMELQASESQIPGMSSLAVDVVDHEGDVLTNESTSILSSKSNSSPSCPSNNFSWTNSGSSRSSGSPGPSAAAAKNAANLHLHQNMTSTPIANSTEPKLGLEDLNSSAALVSKMKEVLKVRPRTEPKSGPRTRIPAPAMVKNQRSKSITNLNLSYDCAASNESKTDTDSAYEQSVTEFSEDTDELSEVSQLTTKCCDDSVLDVNRCKTPVPKLATPLTTGRSTVISNTNSTSRLVRAVSQEPVDHSRSNSLSSLSSRLSLSNADDDMDYV
ncbi:serine/arginine repetitive matrix protein 2 isoform X2 [Patella vulgata]|nr:serine/arginine repetitive matrix protein 2 isoform X2 [Patella vulgata]